MLTVQVPMDHIALIGYTFVFLFSLYKLSDTFRRPVDLFANILLLTGLASLMTFHYKKITTGADVDTDPNQKNVRIVAHTCIAAFFILTLTPMTNAVYRFYDNFALAAHAFLI